MSPLNLDGFLSEQYHRHNRRRQEHLTSLGLNLAGRRVLEIGAGIGDHTDFFVDRGCVVTSTDGRPECVDALRKRFPALKIILFDANKPPPADLEPHDVVYAYGILYHLRDPAGALRTMAHLCVDMLLLETCVSRGNDSRLVVANEPIDDPTQALDGHGCRPTRRWVWDQLTEQFPYVYLTKTQPWHEEFPINWTLPTLGNGQLIRSIFVASRRAIDNPLLVPRLLDIQSRA
jgi:SAM-dependent methyltransferase